MGTAAQRVAPGPDHKDHQDLGRHRLDKPARSKQRFLGIEPMNQHVKGQEIKQGTDRPDRQHEITDKAHVPLLGLRQVFRIDMVQRQGNFRHVVEQVVEQNLQRQHGQKGQEKCRGRHAEHVAKVGTGGHHDVLHDVAKGAPPLQNALVQHHQVALQKDHVGGLLGHIHRPLHRNAHICSVQRGRIVDAIAQITHHMPTRFQRQDDAVLL